MPNLIVKRGNRVIDRVVLSEDVFTIGRGGLGLNDRPDIVLSDKSRRTSRYHAAIVLNQEGAYYVRDLGSANGTKVNGRPCYRKQLIDGDRIQIGDFFLIYAEEDSDELHEPPLVIVDERPVALPRDYGKSTISERKRDKLHAKLTPDMRRNVNDVVKRISNLTDFGVFCSELLGVLAAALSAERGFVARLEPPASLMTAATYGIDRERGDHFRVAPQILNQAVQEHKAVRSDLGDRATICCALRSEAEFFGIAYLESRSRGHFREQDSTFLTAICQHLGKDIGRVFSARKPAAGGSPVSQKLKWKSKVVGRSLIMREKLQAIQRCAATDMDILLLGETGTGKEIVARTIHHSSSRRDGPFVAVELSKLEAGHVEGELFGWSKGAFTGAVRDRKGVFELADGGTLFLDEIGDVTLEVQAKLRRAVEEKEITPLGTERAKKVDVRIISATNIDLDQAANDGTFRFDLLKRLGMILRLPRLSERREDIALLAHFFIDEFDIPVNIVSNGAMRILEKYPWPGNVRELRELVRGWVVIDREIVFSWDIPSEITSGCKLVTERGFRTIREIEKAEIQRVLEHTSWNVSEATRILGYGSKQTLYNKMRDFGIERSIVD